MTRVILNGYLGKMGKVLVSMINKMNNMEVVAGIDLNNDTIETNFDFNTFKTPETCTSKGQVIIDFSSYKAVNSILDLALNTKTPIVIATTGLTEENINKIDAVSKTIPVFLSANMSLGINVMAEALKKMTIGLEEDFHIEIVESHHSLKKDSPSGTALLLADTIDEASQMERNYVYGRYGKEEERAMEEIGIHSIRGGTNPGEHTVIFAGEDEVLEIKHTALSRNIFAKGAIKAALFIKDKNPGLYSMDDLLK